MEDYPTALDPKFSWLKQLLQQNRQIELAGLDERRYESSNIYRKDPKIRQICALNRFFRGSQTLTREPPSIRLSLVGAALTYSAAKDAQRTELLLADHTDLLWELVEDVVSTDGVGDDIIELAREEGGRESTKVALARVGRKKGQKCQRKLDA